MLNISEDVRQWVHGVLVSVGAVLVYYGAIDTDALPLWLDVAAATLVTGGAVARRGAKGSGHGARDVPQN